MKINLVNPPSPFLLDERVFPPLGLLQVAAVLEEAGHLVEVTDVSGREDYLEEMGRSAAKGWDAYGISATTPQFPATVGLLAAIRSEDPGKRVILGGPHATVQPESCQDFDSVVLGDGEEAVLEAIQPGAPKILDYATNTTKGTLAWHWPARHLIDMNSYRYSLMGVKGTSMMLSQGCPYNCSFCFQADTLVLTDVGAVPIRDIVRRGVGQRVWTSKGPRTIVRRFEHDYSDQMVKVKVRGRPAFVMTPGHNLLTKRGWVSASELVQGDEVRVQAREATNDPTVIDLLTLLPDLKESEGLVRFKWGKKWAGRWIPVDRALARLVGLYLAEGSVHFQKNRPNSGTVAWTFERGESLIAETIQLVRQVLGVTPAVSDTNTAIQVSFTHAVYARMFEVLFGRGAAGKRLPLEWLDLPDDLLEPLVQGVLDGDGHYDLSPSHGQGRWRVSTVSPSLAIQLSLLVARLGIPSSVSVKHKAGVGRIEGRAVQFRTAYEWGLSGKFCRRNQNPLLWAPVVRVTREVFEGSVFNLEIDDYHAYSVWGLEVSNCCGRLVPYYRRVRAREVDSVVAEMRHLVDTYGIKSVMAFDDEVNLLNEPLLEFCSKIKPLGMKFRAFVKANLFNDIQAEAMANAGFVEVCTGVESGDDRILGIIDKQTTREINRRFVEVAQKHGMRAKAFCSLGHPGENHESAENLKSWLIEAKPDDFDVTVITIYPGTPIWAKRETEYVNPDGRRICRYTKRSKNSREDGATLFFEEVDYTKEWAFYKGKPGEYVSHVWTPDLSPNDLTRLRDEIEDAARTALGIPYPKRFSGDQFEHTMGAGVTPQDSRTQLKGSV